MDMLTESWNFELFRSIKNCYCYYKIVKLYNNNNIIIICTMTIFWLLSKQRLRKQ